MPRKLKPGQFSRKYDCCIECGTTEIIHQARGMCRVCYYKEYGGNYTSDNRGRALEWHNKNIVANTVYVLKSHDPDDCHYKIGLTRNMRRNTTSVQRGNPYTVSVVCTKKLKDRDSATKVETILHHRYKEKSIKGTTAQEWFCLSDNDITDIEKYLNDIDLQENE